MKAFEFQIDKDQRLLTVVLRGFWDIPTYFAYDLQVTEHLKALNRLPPPRSCLVDAREFLVQPQDVADGMSHGLAQRLPLYPPRTARVVGFAICRSQAVRMTSMTEHGVFTAIEPAMAWLSEDSADMHDSAAR